MIPRPDQPLPTGAAKSAAVRDMFDTIAPRYDLVNRLMTFGLDVRWRRRAVRSLGLPAGATVYDLACGTGDLCNDLARAGYAPVGFDYSQGMLDAARTDAPLVCADVLDLPVGDASADGVVCGFALRNFTDLDAFFASVARVTRPGGKVAFVDAAQPDNRLARAVHAFYFGKVVPLIGGLLSDPDAYRYLPRSLGYMPPADELVRRLAAAGFTDVDRTLLTFGAAHLLTATRR